MEGYLNTVYRGDPSATTEWDDIQRKLGNLPAKDPAWKPDAFVPEEEVKKDKDWIDRKDEEELSDLEDEFENDRFMEEYRLKRIQELQNASRKPRFGTVEEIRGSEFVQKVTNAGPDVHVVVHLYKDGHAGSAMIGQYIEQLAAKYTSTKFLRIVSTDCIQKYPDSNLPTLLLYYDGSCSKHLVGLTAMGGPRTSPEQVALILNTFGSFCTASGEDGEVEEQAQVRSLVQRIVEQRVEQAEKDASSDFED